MRWNAEPVRQKPATTCYDMRQHVTTRNERPVETSARVQAITESNAISHPSARHVHCLQ
jgi:hypothetical protein